MNSRAGALRGSGSAWRARSWWRGTGRRTAAASFGAPDVPHCRRCFLHARPPSPPRPEPRRSSVEGSGTGET